MRQSSGQIYTALEFERLRRVSGSANDRHQAKTLYALRGLPGVFSRVPRTGKGNTPGPGNLLAYFNGKKFECRRDKEIDHELALAGLFFADNVPLSEVTGVEFPRQPDPLEGQPKLFPDDDPDDEDEDDDEEDVDRAVGDTLDDPGVVAPLPGERVGEAVAAAVRDGAALKPVAPAPDPSSPPDPARGKERAKKVGR
jgi:hypothetical protein